MFAYSIISKRNGPLTEPYFTKSHHVHMRYRSQDRTILRKNTKDIRKVHSLTSNVEPDYNNGEYVAEDLEYSIDSNTEWNHSHNETFSDNDSDTIPYEESDSETVPYKKTDSDNEQYIDSPHMTKSGRQIKRKCPIDYDDYLWKCWIFLGLIFSFSKRGRCYIYTHLCSPSFCLYYVHVGSIKIVSLKHNSNPCQLYYK